MTRAQAHQLFQIVTRRYETESVIFSLAYGLPV
jgi:hypothetical protein